MEKKVTVGGVLNTSINFAMQQNYVPIIRNLIVNNESEENLKNLTLRISFEPGFAREFSYEIEELAAGSSFEISPVRIQLSTEFLFSLTEKMVGTIIIDLIEEDKDIYNFTNEIELLAYDEWSGLLIMPETITAFVTPNHPKVTAILSRASKFLNEWMGQPSFTGYQTRNPNNVKFQMAAIYAALHAENIIYNNPPASYEIVGQRVRMPHMVVEQKQGTCLDLSILYAACLEAAGLFPLIIFMKGHAYSGCWLEEETFADCAVDDVSALEKRIVPGAEELLLVECTDYVQGGNVDFEKALKHGKDHLNQPGLFDYVIDVQRSRGSGIRPIPIKLPRTESFQENVEEENGETVVFAPKEMDRSMLGKLAEDNRPLTKQKIWERRLLDFSLRNTLLNFRVTKNAIQIMTADLGELEDRLSDGKDFRVMEVPSEWTMSPRDAKMFEIETEKDLIQTIATMEFKSQRIRTFLPSDILEKNLKNLHRAAKVSMEENGTNTLFLALGFLRWFESDLSEKARYAPIILIPVDLVRNSRNKGFVIRSRQEEAQINITLLEYLRQDYGIKIGGLDPLPLDEHGTDLPLVFNTMRQAIMGKKRWNIENMAFLGLFSFGQFVMWNDIRNRSEDLEKNKVVASLIEGRMTWQPEDVGISTDMLDAKVEPDKMAIPVSADSSQMVAIAAAAAGESFVLHGPPGTGKSQTITNMIANTLYQGKSVLFVAEKMAALNVVQKRLADIGLDSFCLELHSNKTNKTAVLGQLNQALEIGRIKPPEAYKATADYLHHMRQELNYIIEAIHCKREYGCSLYEAVEIFEQTKSEKDKIDFSGVNVQSVSGSEIDGWSELIRQYTVVIEEIGLYENHPLKGYKGTVYSMELRNQFENDLKAVFQQCDSTEEIVRELLTWSGLEQTEDKPSVIQLMNFIEAALNPIMTLTSFVQTPNFGGVKMQLDLLAQVGKEYNELSGKLLQNFQDSVFSYNVDDALTRWNSASATWFFPKMLKQNSLVKELKAFSKNPSEITKESIQSYYEELRKLSEKKKQIEMTSPELAGFTNGIYMGLQTDWNQLNAAIEKSVTVREAVRAFPESKRENLIHLADNPSEGEKLRGQVEKLQLFIQSADKLTNQYSVDMKDAENSQNWIMEVKNLCEKYRDNISELKSWVDFNIKDKELREKGLAVVSEAYKQNKVDKGNIKDAFRCNLFYRLSLQTISSDSRLADFRGRQYEDMILKYKETIDKFQKMTIQELVSKLSEKVPANGGDGAASSELGILKRAIKSNGRMMPIRKLFDQIPTLLRRICPCMLMSPISVAQYIDPAFPKFDLVIFDEASQLPTSEAVGTIARGENVIVVGDPKQLPPTSFFTSNRVDEENSEKEDLESLLDDCLAISMPQEHLKWHYRSRHESLIAYSNVKYYDNKLYTFPSPNDLVSEVKMVHLDGYYDKGKTKQNLAEAKAVVSEIVRRLRDERLRNDSIGVVTFSSVQQNLIEDLLLDEFSKHPELEEIDNKSKEPVFIKNLENVQGDERDIILFSIGYGPDKEGKVSMNFGPLNRDGGWRRLNVAISRARKSMIVYAVIKPEQIDLSRTRSEGVAGLKGFLEFAERGKNVLAVRSKSASTHVDTMINEIAEAIEKMGYKVKCNIGCSEYKMDIGVIHPNKENTYLLGILMDGENCREAATSKDRFMLQPNVLTGLGWKIMRVWMLEWLDNQAHVEKEIEKAIKEAIENDAVEKEAIDESNNQTQHLEFEKMDVSEISDSLKQPYQSVEISQIGMAEAFYGVDQKTRIRDKAKEILEKEAPISHKLLMRKVLSCWNISRSGSRVEGVFLGALDGVAKQSIKEGETLFYWKPSQNPMDYKGYRVEDQFGEKRSMEDVSSYEILNAILEVLTEQISLSQKDLVRETAKKFGFSRMGNVIETAVNGAINLGLEKEKISLAENGNVIIR